MSSFGSSLAIEVQGLTKRYGELVAVDGISFTVKRGEFFGFLGPNGAGKTTTLRMLTGVIRPDGGRALIFGHVAGSLAAKQLRGVVPEMANAYGDLSGWQNLMLMAGLYGVPATLAHQRATELLKEVGLLPKKDELVRKYSKGMRQRLIMAMALISDPVLLFLDEPTSGLDVQSARLIRDLLRRLNEEGKTIFLTTHDMEEANELCQRVAIIDGGRIVAIEAPEKLKEAVRASHTVEVSFERPVPLEDLQQIPAVKGLKRTGDKYLLRTQDPGALIVDLANYSCSAGLRIISIHTVTPSLEDAFLALTKGKRADG